MWNIILPALLAAAGKNVQSEETQSAYDRQRREVQSGRTKSRRKVSEGNKKLMEAVKAFDPTQRQAVMDTKAGEQEQRILDITEKLTGGTGTIQPGTERTSQAVLDQRASNVRDRANEASVLAALTGKLGAVDSAALDERSLMKSLGVDARDTARGATRDIDRSRTLAEMVGRPNKKRMMLGGLAEGLGTSVASGQILGALTAGTGGKTSYDLFNPDGGGFTYNLPAGY